MLGQSFLPGGNDDRMRQDQAGAGPSNPIQEAIKVLSLKLPRVVGAGAPAPQELLTGLGGAGVQNPIAQILQQMFGQGSPQAAGGAMGGESGAGMPAPPPSGGKPRIDIIPAPSLPGGTAGPGPGEGMGGPNQNGGGPFRRGPGVPPSRSI